MEASTAGLPLPGVAAARETRTVDPRLAVREVAEQFGEPARSTILFENWYKHLFELQLIREFLPEAGTLIDVGGGLGVNLICLRRLGYRGRIVLIDRFAEYDSMNRMGAQERGRAIVAEHDVEVLESEFWPTLALPVGEAQADVVTSFD